MQIAEPENARMRPDDAHSQCMSYVKSEDGDGSSARRDGLHQCPCPVVEMR